MHSDKRQTSSKAATKIRRLGAGIVIAILLYSAGWYFAASKFETYARDFVAKNSAEGRSIDCAGFRTGGFPFLLGFDCNGLKIEDASGASLTSGAIKAAARAYAPGSAVLEFDGPAHASLADGSVIDARWNKFRGFIHAGLSGLGSLSLETETASSDIDLAAIGARFKLSSDDLQLHLRDNGGNLEVAALTRNLVISDPANAALLPMLSASIEYSLDGKGPVLQGKPYGDIASGGRLTSLKLESENGIYGEMSGDFTIDDEGYLNGKFKTRLENISQWSKVLRQTFPDADNTIASLEALLRGLAKGKDDVKVTLSVDRGRISLSFIPLGQLPPF